MYVQAHLDLIKLVLRKELNFQAIEATDYIPANQRSPPHLPL
jgi:hypothetical protein